MRDKKAAEAQFAKDVKVAVTRMGLVMRDYPPVTRGAALGEVLATHIAGFVLMNAGEADQAQLTEDLLGLIVDHARKLIPLERVRVMKAWKDGSAPVLTEKIL